MKIVTQNNQLKIVIFAAVKIAVHGRVFVMICKMRTIRQLKSHEHMFIQIVLSSSTTYSKYLNLFNVWFEMLKDLCISIY